MARARVCTWCFRGLLLAGACWAGWHVPEAIAATREVLEPAADLVALVLLLLGGAAVVALWRPGSRECEIRLEVEVHGRARGPVNGGRLP